MSQRQACRAIGVWPSTCRYRSQARDQTRCGCAVGSWPRPECDRATGGCTSCCRPAAALLLPREGWRVNAKRIFRLYQLEGLSLRLKSRKKRVSAPRVVRPAERPKERWSMDFVSDSLAAGGGSGP